MYQLLVLIISVKFGLHINSNLTAITQSFLNILLMKETPKECLSPLGSCSGRVDAIHL